MSQGGLDPRRDRVRASEHAPGSAFRVLERRYGLANIVERGAVVLVRGPPHGLQRVLVSYLDKERDPASIYHEAHTKLTIPVGKALIDQLTYLETEFAKMDRMRDDALQRGIRTLKVTYEDLVKDKGAGLERVAKFVSAGTGCDAAGFTYTGEEASWHVVHPHPMSSYVKDWKDVASTLRGTRFEKFLAMDGSSPQ